MSKVIVERPRIGGDGGKSDEPKGYKKKLQKALNDESGDQTWSHESNAPRRKHGWGAKELSERLGPLRKFLRSKVGQHWDAVWSEICDNLRAENAVQSHVRDHVNWDVARDVIMVDGKPVNKNKEYGIYSPFYVNPETGILCETPKNKRRHKQNFSKRFVTSNNDDMIQYHIVDNVWYEIKLAPFPPYVEDRWKRDVVNDILIRGSFGATRSDCARFYGRSNVYGVSKRQLNGKEIKKLKLWETDVGINALKEKK